MSDPTPEMRPSMTERTWDPNAWPTVTQFLPWFDEQPPKEREHIMRLLLEDAASAHNCLVRNHSGALLEVEHLRARVAGYREALSLASTAMDQLRARVSTLEGHIKSAQTTCENNARNEYVTADQEARKGAHARARARSAAGGAWLDARRLLGLRSAR